MFRFSNKSKETPVLKALDKFYVSGGIASAVGWVGHKSAPKIIYDGKELSNQISEREIRQDVANVHGDTFTDSGFRVCAFVPNAIDHSKLSVRFADGSEISKAAARPGTLYAILDRFKAQVAENSDGRMIEIGSRARSGNTYRQMFEGLKHYTGIDVAEGPNVDVVADAHQLSKHFGQQFDFVFSISVFEHLVMPWVAAFEMSKVMVPGGIGYIQSHQAWPLHEVPWDFFRFSEHSWHGLFNKYTGFEVIESGFEYPAMLTSHVIDGRIFEGLDTSDCHLLSGCLIRKISDPLVDWSADASKIIDIEYAH